MMDVHNRLLLCAVWVMSRREPYYRGARFWTLYSCYCRLCELCRIKPRSESAARRRLKRLVAEGYLEAMSYPSIYRYGTAPETFWWLTDKGKAELQRFPA